MLMCVWGNWTLPSHMLNAQASGEAEDRAGAPCCLPEELNPPSVFEPLTKCENKQSHANVFEAS